MGVIEISDGLTNRQIPVRELTGTVRIETFPDQPRVIVPSSVTVEHDVRTDRAGCDPDESEPGELPIGGT